MNRHVRLYSKQKPTKKRKPEPNRTAVMYFRRLFEPASKKKLHAPASLSDEKTKAVWRSQFLIFLSIRIVVSLFLLFSLLRYTR